MGNTLLLGFKGKNNLSGLLVKQLEGDSCLLTNSFSGLKKDIDAIGAGYDCAVLFGTDKDLAGTVRIEGAAEKEGVRRFPDPDGAELESLAAEGSASGIRGSDDQSAVS